jgi:hypothetical protein
VRSYYASVSGYRDELLWAALWLHRATGRDEYLRYAVDKADSFGGVGWAMTEFSWDVKYAGVQVLAAKVPLAVFLDHQLAAPVFFLSSSSSLSSSVDACNARFPQTLVL